MKKERQKIERNKQKGEKKVGQEEAKLEKIRKK